MSSGNAAIRPLPKEVAAQIKSSATLTSLEDVLVGLFKNSLDAGSRKIDISVDFVRGGCTVEDDGCGVSPGEFLDTGGLGKLFCMFVPCLFLCRADTGCRHVKV